MARDRLRIIPLGGLGEIGRNMMAVEYGNEIVVIDAGVLFPDENMPGVDFIIPDITYLVENKEKVKAVLITHGHEDHTGALPYVLPELGAPLYASRLTHGLIAVKLREHGHLKTSRLNVVEPHQPFKVGGFRVEFFRVCHSIPDAMGIALTTPLGTIIHTGDFKIDHTPVDGQPTDFLKLAELASRGVLLLCSDSTYAEVEGYTLSERVVGEALDHFIAQAEGRVMVATFASLISRMQQVIDAAVKYGRKVAVVGRSMSNNLNMAINMGYLDVPPDTIVSLNEATRLPRNQVVILATGSQGEPTSALVRIANGEHQDVEIEQGDLVVISASPIPGNETVVSKTIDNLYRRGAKVLYSRIGLVHVHGHGSREELKLMLNLVRPKFFVPVHGEHRHLVTHAALAQEVGVPPENTFVLDDGDVLELTEEEGRVVGQVPAEYMYVDGQRVWAKGGQVLDERTKLSRDGVVVVSAVLDRETGEALKSPKVASSGFVGRGETQELFEKVSEMVQTLLDQRGKRALELDKVKAEVNSAVSDLLYKETRRRPTVLTLLDRV
ncbi:MAG: ribonuclease J [SAR202 cluster bacterium]|nr:ribonuclease J [SAR202 cluster bacterium]